MSPFLPGNKILLNEDNDDNPEATDNSISRKDDMSHTSPDDFTKKTYDKKITNNDDEYKEEISKIKEGNESVDTSETPDDFCDDIIIKTTTKKIIIDSKVEDYDFKISCNTFCDKYCSFVLGKNDIIGQK